jgi:hypothetical protein
MTQTSNRFFDEASAADERRRRRRPGRARVRPCCAIRPSAPGDLDVVKREEFEAVKEMARLAREENEALKARIAALEAKVEAKVEVKPAETKFAAGSGDGTSGQA